jgi:hypothetical protein
VFPDLIIFSFALSAIGLAIIALGLLLHRNYAKLEAGLNEMLPEAMRWLRPYHARHA